jgi:hypothetical protein
MKYLSLDLSLLRSPAYVGSEPVERATWFNLLAYCCDQENGGRIKRCRGWKCRQWQQTCGITQLEAQLESELWQWDEDDLLVYGYPYDVQAGLEAKRKAGSRGGKASGKARREAVLEAQLEDSSKDTSNVSKVSKTSNVSKVDSAPTPLTPTREEFLHAAHMAGVEAHIAEIWFDEAESRPFSPDGHWTSKSGQPIINWRSALKAYAGKWQANAANGRKRPSGASDAAPSVWEAKQKIDVLRGQIRRIEANPDNKIQAEDSYERVLRPEKKAEVKELKAKIKQLEAVIAA